MRIEGRKISERILSNLKLRVKKLKAQNITPHLAIILIGNDPASVAYVRQKKIKAEQIGAKTTIEKLPPYTTTAHILQLLNDLNHLNNVHGIIVQQPLPASINIKKVTEVINPKKDVDGFRPKSKFKPPIALAILQILEEVRPQGIEWLKLKNITIIGKGQTGGKPVIQTLKQLGVEPLVIDSKTKNPKILTKTADIIISAVGKANIIKPEMIKQDVVLISIGLHKDRDGKLHGDYDEEKIKDIASFYTPTPGGVGPVNVAMLLKNLIDAALFSH